MIILNVLISFNLRIVLARRKPHETQWYIFILYFLFYNDAAQIRKCFELQSLFVVLVLLLRPCSLESAPLLPFCFLISWGAHDRCKHCYYYWESVTFLLLFPAQLLRNHKTLWYYFIRYYFRLREFFCQSEFHCLHFPYSIYQSGGSASNGSKLSQRIASLVRFREKRKERSFEKKIRYSCRKEVAQR